MGILESKAEINSNVLKEKIESGKYKLINLKNLTYRGEQWKPNFNLSGKIYGSSFQTQKLTSFQGLTLIRGFYKAYEEHCPISISPDMIWLLIIQAFSNHVNFNAEKLRDLFVDFEGQKTLQVSVEKAITELKTEEFEESFKGFSEQIEKYIGKEKKEIFDFNFSTTTPTIKTVGYASLMSGMQKFFIYEMLRLGCGFPFIILEGELNDWLKIKENLSKLEPYLIGLEEWFKRIQKIIDKIISEFSSEKYDTKFWKDIIHKDKVSEGIPSAGGTRNVEGIEGWLLEFYPYKPDGTKRENLYGPIKFRKLADQFTSDILITPIKFIDLVENKTYDLELRSGFFGMQKIEEEGNLVKPEIGWVVSDKCEDYKAKKIHSFK